MALPKLNSLAQLYAGVPDDACDKLHINATIGNRTTVLQVSCDLPLSYAPKRWLDTLAQTIVENPAFNELEESRRKYKLEVSKQKVERGGAHAVGFLEYSRTRFAAIRVARNDFSFMRSKPALLSIDTEGRPEPRIAQVFVPEEATVYIVDYPMREKAFMDYILDPAIVKVVCDKLSELRALGVKSQDLFEKCKNAVNGMVDAHLRTTLLTGTESNVCAMLDGYLTEVENERLRCACIADSFVDVQSGRAEGRKALVSIIEDVCGVLLQKPREEVRCAWGTAVSEEQIEYAAYDAVWNWEVYRLTCGL